MAQKNIAQKICIETFATLRNIHPDAHCELDHKDAFQLVVATVLSAQTTDVAVNKVTPGLFAKYKDARALAQATPEEIQPLIDRIGMFRMKSKSVVGLAKMLVQKHKGKVPQTMADLVELPGVGRKTANVVLGVMWQKPDGVVVDTHVQRISQRLGGRRAPSRSTSSKTSASYFLPTTGTRSVTRSSFMGVGFASRRNPRATNAA